MQAPTTEHVLNNIFVYLEENAKEPLRVSLSAKTRLVDDLHLDSLDGAEMLSVLEDRFEITLSVMLLQRAETLGDVAQAVSAAIGSELQ